MCNLKREITRSLMISLSRKMASTEDTEPTFLESSLTATHFVMTSVREKTSEENRTKVRTKVNRSSLTSSLLTENESQFQSDQIGQFVNDWSSYESHK